CHGKGMLERSDGRFDASPPAQRPPEPSLLLQLCASLSQSSPCRQSHSLDSSGFRLPFVACRIVPSVPSRHIRRPAEVRLMLLQGGTPCVRVGRVPFQNLALAYDAPFRLVNAHQTAELRGLVDLPFADGSCVRL